MASATLLVDFKKRYPDGAILEMVVWRLPEPERVRGSTHEFKYRLFYGVPGVRIVSYDNEAGKGDHVHRGANEAGYVFVSPEGLIEDFLGEVRQLRGDDL